MPVDVTAYAPTPPSDRCGIAAAMVSSGCLALSALTDLWSAPVVATDAEASWDAGPFVHPTAYPGVPDIWQ